VVPIFADQQWWGFIEFDEAQSGRLWMLAELEALRAAASMIGSAIQHGRVVEALRQSEERFRTIADFTYGWEYWVSPSGSYLYVSPSCERITGYEPTAFQQEPALFTQIVHPEDRAFVAFHLNQEASEGGDRQGEGEGEHTEIRFRIVTKEGELRWIGHVSQPIYSADGTWLGRRGSNRDITEQVGAEEALKREQRLFIGGPVVVFKWRAGDSWDVEYVSPNVIQFGYQPEAFTSGAISYTTFIHPDDQDRIALEMRTYAEVEDTWFEQDYRIIQADGQIRWVYAFNRIIRANTGDITHYDGYILDITDRKQVEAALRQSEEQFRTFVERTDDLVVQLDSTSVITYVNHVVKRILGLSEEECIGKKLFDFMPNDDRKRIQIAFTSWLKNNASSVTFEGRLIHRSGASHTMHWSMNMRYTPDGTLLTVNGIGRDFTERKRVEETLREREARYRTISELVSDFAYALRVEQDNTLVLEWVTDAFSRITGFTMQEVEKQGGWYSLVYPDDVMLVRQSYDWLLSGQHSDEYEFRIVTGQGDIRWLRNHHRPVWDKSLGRVARIYGGMRDVTEWKQAMEAMQESEQKFHCFFEQSQDGMVLMNNLGYIVECNHRAEVIWGQKQYDVMGLTLWDVLFEAIPDQQKQGHAYEQMKAHFEQQMQADYTVRQEWVVQEICTGDGVYKVVESLVFPIQTDHGTLMGGVMRVRSDRHVDGA
jgi:PAS domain S-box-containing protein